MGEVVDGRLSYTNTQHHSSTIPSTHHHGNPSTQSCSEWCTVDKYLTADVPGNLTLYLRISKCIVLYRFCRFDKPYDLDFFFYDLD